MTQEALEVQRVRDEMASVAENWSTYTLRTAIRDAQMVDNDAKAHRLGQRADRIERIADELRNGEFISKRDREFLVTALRARGWFEYPFAKDNGIGDTEEAVETFATVRTPRLHD